MRTRPAISWSDLPGRLVGVWGLGVEGRATIRKLDDLGVTSLLVDDQPPAEGVDGRHVDATDDGGLEALARCDVVIKTPGISRYRPEVDVLEFGGTPVVGGLGLWLAEADLDRVVCITGTKGKSTTTAIAGHLLTRLGHRVLVGGNLGLPPYDPEAPTDVDHWVIEVSSYQAADVPVSPPVVAVTSLHPDHLPWHRDDAETYYADKLSLCRQPGADLTIANGDSPLLRDRAALLGPRVEWVTVPTTPAASGSIDDWTAALGLLGAHNHRNALIARACLVALGVDGARDDAALATAAEGFQHLDSRLRPVDTVDGVLFVDDSLSTNVLPTLAAVDAFPGRRVAVIVGGQDRGIDYGPLAVGLAHRTDPTLVTITDSEAAARIRAAFDVMVTPDHLTVMDCADLGSAVDAGHRWARPDGVVLLSPAAPSFDRFRDYRARAAAFVDAVSRLEPEQRHT